MSSKVTIQNGQFQDAAGTAIVGTLVLQLSQDAVVSGTGTVAPTSISIAVTAGNAVATPVWGNDNLTPSGTTYTATLFDTSGARVWGPENWSITGAGPIEINTLVPATTSVSYSGAVLLAPSGDQTINAAHLLNASLGTVTAGKLNSVRIVDGVKFTTIAAAVADLPTTTLGGNNYAIGTVYLPKGSYTLSSVLTLSPFVTLMGDGSQHTVISCTATGDCISFTNSPAQTNLGVGGLIGMTVSSNGSASQVGLHGVDQTCGFVLQDVVFEAFNGTGAVGAKFDNTAKWTERQYFRSVSFDHCTTGLQFNGVGANDSFGHNTWLDLRFNLNASQTAISLTGTALVYSSILTGVINHDNTTGSSTVFNLAGTSQVQSTVFLNLLSDNNGGATAVGVSSVVGTTFTPSGNFRGFTSNSASGVLKFCLPVGGTDPTKAIDYVAAPDNWGLAATSSLSTAGQGMYLIPQLGALGSFYAGVGFNVKFDGTNFVTIPDGSNNGGSVILSSYSGAASMLFFSIPSTGNTAQTISPATLASTYLRGTLDAGGLKLSGAGALSLRGDNSAVDPGNPWIRTDGGNIVVNAHGAGKSVFLGLDSGGGAVVTGSTTPTSPGGSIGLASVSGFGNGAAGTAVTTTLIGTGSGPATPQTVVKYLQIDVGGTKYWLPLVQ